MAEPEPALPTPPSAQPAANAPVFTLREVARFGALVSIILLSANAFVCATASHFFGLPGWIVWQALPGALALAFIPATILRFRFNHPALRIIYALSAAWLGALNFAFFAAAACWIVDGVVSITALPWPRFAIAAVLFGAALLTTVYGLLNASSIRTSRVTIQLPNLPPAWQGRTAALVTDLHLGPLSGQAFLRRVIARLRTLQPDAVFIGGDMFDGPALGLDQLVAPWREFSAPRGIFYVTGNHDEFLDRTLFLNAAQRTGIIVLNNEKVTLDGLQVVGVHDHESTQPDELRAILHHAKIDRLHPSLLLAHRPINLTVAMQESISLQLSGHTHGGQIWPWNLLVARIYGRFAQGLSRLGPLQVYTSNGVGTWGPPLRVATKSEIILIQFESETPSTRPLSLQKG